MSVVRLCAIEALAEILIAEIPELEGKVCVGVPPNTHDQTYPSMTINAVTWKFEPDDPEELDMGSFGESVRRVGTHEATVQIRILAATQGERDTYASRVVDVFAGFEDEDGCPHPGTILARVTACTVLPWTACFDLASDRWINQRAFESKYEALIEVDGLIPALVVKQGVYSIRELVLGVIHDFTTPIDETTITTTPAVELVEINEDGSIEPYAP